MKKPNNLMESAGEAYGYARAYAEQQLEYYKLEIAERVSISLSAAITIVIIGMVLLIFTMFLSLALGFYLAEKLGSFSQAFLIVSGIHAAIALIVIVFRRHMITNPILSKIIKIFFEKQV